MSEFNICGVLVYAKPGQGPQVSRYLEKMPGVEIHSLTDDDRLVVTIESDTRGEVADTLSDFHKVEHVLSASMVYQYSD
jgi:nitrate reductase NapD